MLRSSHVPRTPTLTKQCWVASTQPRRWHSDRPSQPTAPNALQERPSLALPLPPVLDEELIAARRSKSFKQPKPLQDAAKLTDFQKRLAANPYARALASPIRFCTFTLTRLPQHFLLPFTPEFHHREAPGRPPKLIPRLTLCTNDRIGKAPRTNLVNSRSMLRLLDKKKNWHRLINRDIQDYYRMRDKKDWTWPTDMDMLVLQHLRQEVVAKLAWAFRMPRAGLVAPMDELDAGSSEAACILRLRIHEGSVANDHDIPVFDIQALLGEDSVKELILDTEFADADAVAVANSQPTTVMRVRLLRLQDFLNGRS